MTPTIISQTQKQFRDYIYRDVEPTAFDSWLCTTEGLEALIGEESYFKLIDLDYSKKDDIEESKQVAAQVYGDALGGDLIKDRARDALRGLLDGTWSPYVSCSVLSELRTHGADFIPAVFDGYTSELNDPNKLTHYRDRLIVDAQKLLDTIGIE